MNGETCSDLGTRWPLGSKSKTTRSPHGVFVTSAAHARRRYAPETPSASSFVFVHASYT